MARSQAELREFYETGYSIGGERGDVYAKWRALGAKGKVDHILELLPPLGDDVRVLDVGCGDGALLAELRTRRPAWSLAGVEVAAAAAKLAADRNPDADVRRYDGEELPFADDEYAAGVLSHVLEHVVNPADVLRETARVCRRVIVEVPLEANLSALRGSRARAAEEIGHLQRFSRRGVRGLIGAAGLKRYAELTDPLPREVHGFFATTRTARIAADAKWALRTAGHRLAAGGASRVYTLHYAALCGP